ncbi:MAG: hypothetical protein ACYTFG_21335, partial [Planctomycetota bacterium]
HIHQADDTEIDVYAMRNGIEFPMGNGGYNGAYGLEQVPRLFLLDKDGVVVWEGSDIGGDFNRALSKALRNVDYMGETALPKELRAAKKLIAQRMFGKAIEKLVDYKINPKKPEEEKKKVVEFIEKLETLGDREFIRGTSAIRTLNPGRGIQILEKVAREFKGHPVGRKALLRLEEVRKDPEVKPQIEAWELFVQFRAAIKAGNPRAASAKAAYLQQKHPKSPYVRMCGNLLEAYGRME